MREIKFRSWDRCKMENVFVWDKNNIHFEHSNRFSNELIYGIGHKDVYFMQFTGLKDKKGKDIYEGDIVELYSDIYKINFKNGAFGFDPIFPEKVNENDVEWDSIWDYDNNQLWSDEFYILGNIYENPELLEEK